MVLNMRVNSETAHLTWKGVYNNCHLQDKVSLIAIACEHIRENYTSFTSCVVKHTDSLPHASEFDDGYRSGPRLQPVVPALLATNVVG